MQRAHGDRPGLYVREGGSRILKGDSVLSQTISKTRNRKSLAERAKAKAQAQAQAAAAEAKAQAQAQAAAAEAKAQAGTPRVAMKVDDEAERRAKEAQAQAQVDDEAERRAKAKAQAQAQAAEEPRVAAEEAGTPRVAMKVDEAERGRRDRVKEEAKRVRRRRRMMEEVERMREEAERMKRVRTGLGKGGIDNLLKLQAQNLIPTVCLMMKMKETEQEAAIRYKEAMQDGASPEEEGMAVMMSR